MGEGVERGREREVQSVCKKQKNTHFSIQLLVLIYKGCIFFCIHFGTIIAAVVGRYYFP